MESLPYGNRDAVEAAVREFLGDHPRASEWKEWRRALAQRLEALKQEKSSQPPGSGTSELDAQIQEIETYLAVLAEEAAITEFVEDSVKASVSMPLDDEEEVVDG
ncbi:MAG: hypothetical protein ACUVTZ_13615 [Armatimonadota bacterium]